MEPVFIYWDKIKFTDRNDFKNFKVNFNNDDSLTGVLFKKKRDYYITSLSANIKLQTNLNDLKDYDKIKKIAEVSNAILENGTDHLHQDQELELMLEKKYDLIQKKNKRKLFVSIIEFLDTKTKKKKLVSVYSPYEELKVYSLRFETKNAAVSKYTINLLNDDDGKLYLGKRLFFDKKKVIEEIKKEFDKKNAFFIKYNGKLKAIKLEFTDFLAENIERAGIKYLDQIKKKLLRF